MGYVRSVTDTMTTPANEGGAGSSAERARTDVDRVAERFFDAFVDLSPINATYLGVPGREDELDDLSPAGMRGPRATCAAPSSTSWPTRPLSTTSTGSPWRR